MSTEKRRFLLVCRPAQTQWFVICPYPQNPLYALWSYAIYANIPSKSIICIWYIYHPGFPKKSQYYLRLSHVDCSSEKNQPNSKSSPQNWHMGPGKVLYGDLSHARATTTLGFCQRRIYGFSINFVTEMWHFTIICCGDTCVHNRIFVVILV